MVDKGRDHLNRERPELSPIYATAMGTTLQDALADLEPLKQSDGSYLVAADGYTDSLLIAMEHGFRLDRSRPYLCIAPPASARERWWEDPDAR